MAIVEMKRIDLLAMRQDQRKLLRTLQDMGCVEITPLQDEALAEYRTRDDGRLEQVEEPHLGRLMTKIRAPVAPAPKRLTYTPPPADPAADAQSQPQS